MPAAPSWDPGGTYTVIFSDDFTGTSLDSTKWTPGWFGTGISGPVSSGVPYDSANVSVSNGGLNLALGTASGSIVTSDPSQVSPGFAFTGGFIEARISLPADSSGTRIANRPSFWCDGQSWPATGEMDIMAGIGGSAAYSFRDPSGGPGATVGPGYYGWHTFGAYWIPGSMVTYYYDGMPAGTISSNVTSAPMYIVFLNGDGSPAAVPADMVVDWVYVWNAGGTAQGSSGASMAPVTASAPSTGVTVTPSALGQPFGATPAAAALSFRQAPSVTTSGLTLPTAYAVPKQAGTQPGDWILIYVYGGGSPQCAGFTSTAGGTAPSALAVTTASLPAATVNTAYSAQFTASGGSGGGYSWSIPSGSLPSGLVLSSSGSVTGTPVTGTPPPTLTITTAALAGGTVSTAYSATLAASGGSGTGYSWSISGGSLPAGLALSTAGVISGTPTSAGTGSFTAGIRDSAGNTATKALSIVVSAASTLLPVGPSGYTTLVFDDEFSGTSLDTTKWHVASGSINGVSISAADVSVSGGNLQLVLSDGSTGGAIASGNIFTTGMCIEGRVNFPGPGPQFYNFPAFWVSGANWPANGEIDIIECYSGTPVVSYHGNGVNDGIGAPSGNWANAFHTYTCVRTASSFQVYWDGSLKWNRASADNGGPMQIIANVGTISGFPAAFGASSTVLVDYVRMWTP